MTANFESRNILKKQINSCGEGNKEQDGRLRKSGDDFMNSKTVTKLLDELDSLRRCQETDNLSEKVVEDGFQSDDDDTVPIKLESTSEHKQTVIDYGTPTVHVPSGTTSSDHQESDISSSGPPDHFNLYKWNKSSSLETSVATIPSSTPHQTQTPILVLCPQSQTLVAGGMDENCQKYLKSLIEMDTDQAMTAIGDHKIEVYEERFQTLDELKRSASTACDNARNAVNQLADAESYRRFREMTADLERDYLKSLRKCEEDMRKETEAIGDLISQSMTTVRLLAQEEKKYANLRGELKYVTESFMTLQKKWLPSLTELDE